MNNCMLQLDTLYYDEVKFQRIGDYNHNDLEYAIEVNIRKHNTEKNRRQVIVKITGDKEDEYQFVVSVKGTFTLNGCQDDETLIQNNAVAILMPYLRSEVTLLTAQPGVDTVVLPPFNIIEMMKDQEER